MVLGLLDQLLIFLQFYLIELLGLLTGLGATRAVALDISKAFDRFGMLVFFKNLSLIEFQARYLALVLFFH